MKWIKNFLLATMPSVVIVLILLELLFRFVIPAAEIPRGYFYENEKLYTNDTSDRDGRYTLGKFAEIRTRWHINNMTWNSAVDYDTASTRPVLAVIGDSYIEAFQVDTGKSYPDLIRRNLTSEYAVYAFGKSGAPLSQYLHISRYVNRHFKPKVMLINIVMNDFDECIRSLHPEYKYFLQVDSTRSGSIQEMAPEPTEDLIQFHPWKRFFMHSALFRYCFFNLKIAATWRGLKSQKDAKYQGNINVSNTDQLRPVVYKATDYIMQQFKVENPDCRIIFVVDGQRDAIYEHATSDPYILWLHDIMKELTSKYGHGLLDLSEAMQQEYNVKQQPFNSKLDGHWDEYGHAFVARNVLDFLKKDLNTVK